MSKQSIPVRLAGLAMILASLFGASPPPARADEGGAAPDAPAGVTEFWVDRSDDANVSTCTPAPNNCTLRGAINRVNTDGIVNATIRFSDTVTQIDLTTPLPALATTGTYILGGPRLSGSAMASGSMMTIDTSQVEISGLNFINGIGRDISVLSGSGNVIHQNTIGTPTDVVDTCVSAGVTRTSSIGIYIGPAVTGNSGNPSVWIYNNVISCHSVYGIQADGADGLIIGVSHLDSGAAKNWIGTNKQSDILGNGIGVALLANGSNGSKNNQIRNNWVWNSGSQGIWLNGTGANTVNSTATNVIAGNSIRGNGRNVTASGIRLTAGAYWNAIGGATSAETNRIHDNTGDGIQIEGSDLNGILGNVIGASPSYPGNNTGNGILIDSAKDNWIGGYVLGAQDGNEIGGNDGDGIRLTNGARNTNITRNLIGSDSGGVPQPNGASGISILSGSYSTTIGTGILADSNVIAGNTVHGIRIDGATTTSNTIRYNDIGLNTNPSFKAPVAIPNGGFGLVVQNNAHHNRAYNGNYIANNGLGGVWVLSGARDNQFGPSDEVFANTGSGILFSDAEWNRVTGMSFYNNTRDGIEQTSLGANNSWISTTTYLNGGLGIDIATTADDNIPTAGYPVITSVVRASGKVTVTGTSLGSNLTNFPVAYYVSTVYLFRDGVDPSGYGEGQTLVGSANTNLSGVWRITFTEGATPRCYAAYNRWIDRDLFSGLIADRSSEFSRSTCGPAYVPMVVR